MNEKIGSDRCVTACTAIEWSEFFMSEPSARYGRTCRAVDAPPPEVDLRRVRVPESEDVLRLMMLSLAIAGGDKEAEAEAVALLGTLGFDGAALVDTLYKEIWGGL